MSLLCELLKSVIDKEEEKKKQTNKTNNLIKK